MPERPIYDGFSKASLLDPERLRERTDVLFREETRVVNDPAAFNGHETWAGTVSVGVVDDGDVLLVNAPEGWTLPTSPVKAGDDWAAVARRWVAQKTGLAVDIERPVRVRRTSYRLAGSSTRQTTGYDVVFRASALDEETPMDYLNARRATEDGDEWADDWFDRVPDGAPDDADVVADIEAFLGH
jgi:ADP-ribose pyrophosphatase YjhB (NUDIX family)